MKTEAAVEEEKKRDRKRLFYKLHTLPWILSFICYTLFSGIILYTTYYVMERKWETKLSSVELSKSYQMETMETPDKLHSIGHSNVEREFQREAVKLGYGKWIVDEKDLTVKFQWVHPLTEYSSLEGLKNPSDTIHPRNAQTFARNAQTFARNASANARNVTKQDADNVENKYPFTPSDLEFAEHLGMDLEKDLKIQTRNVISQVFIRYQIRTESENQTEMEKELFTELEKTIKKTFEGFKTYKKMR